MTLDDEVMVEREEGNRVNMVGACVIAYGNFQTVGHLRCTTRDYISEMPDGLELSVGYHARTYHVHTVSLFSLYYLIERHFELSPSKFPCSKLVISTIELRQ